MSRSHKDIRNNRRKQSARDYRKGHRGWPRGENWHVFLAFWRKEDHADRDANARSSPSADMNGNLVGAYVWDREDYRNIKKLHHRSVRRVIKAQLKHPITADSGEE